MRLEDSTNENNVEMEKIRWIHHWDLDSWRLWNGGAVVLRGDGRRGDAVECGERDVRVTPWQLWDRCYEV